jgi:hypothetical protein
MIFHDRAGRPFTLGLRYIEIEQRGDALFTTVGAFNVVMTTGWTNHF